MWWACNLRGSGKKGWGRERELFPLFLPPHPSWTCLSRARYCLTVISKHVKLDDEGYTGETCMKVVLSRRMPLFWCHLFWLPFEEMKTLYFKSWGWPKSISSKRYINILSKEMITKGFWSFNNFSQFFRKWKKSNLGKFYMHRQLPFHHVLLEFQVYHLDQAFPKTQINNINKCWITHTLRDDNISMYFT